METTETHDRVQLFLRRYDALSTSIAQAGPQVDEATVREVTGLLNLSGEQCGIAAAILDMSETVEFTLAEAQETATRRAVNPAHCRRHGHMVVVPGFGKNNFNFPDVEELVTGALSRLSANSNTQRRTQEGESEPLNFVLTVTDINDIVRTPVDEAIKSTGPEVTTPTRDLLFGHTPEPQVCYLRDAERLVEQIPATHDGAAKVVEFTVEPGDDLPGSLLKEADGFLDRAEQFITAAENQWPNELPPAGSAAALPPSLQRFFTAGAK